MSVQKTTIKPVIVRDDHNQIISDFIGILSPHGSSEFVKSNSNKVCDSKMKIYRQDGTYEEKDNSVTSSFGWMCSDFIVDENIQEFEMKNLCTRFCKKSNAKATHEICNSSEKSTSRCSDKQRSTHKLQDNKIGTESFQPRTCEPMKLKTPITDSSTLRGTISRSESLVDSTISTYSIERAKKYYEVKADVKMARIQSTQKTIEGPIGPDGKLLKDRLGIDWEKPPTGEELATLLNPYCPKSKVLLSILHNSKYQKVNQERKDPANFTNIIDSRDFKCLPSNEMGLEDIVLKEILDYQSNKDDTNLSIMTEIVLADMKCDIDDVVVKDRRVRDSILTDSGIASFVSNSTRNSTQLDSFDINGRETDEHHQNRSDLFKSMGLSDSFDRSLESYSLECQDFRSQIDLIKDAFQHQEDKTEQLTQNIRSLSKEIEEVNTLDDYLHLLEGNLDKVKYKIDAFRIFCHKTEIEDNNFII